MNIQPIFPSFLASEQTEIDCKKIVDFCKVLEKQRPSYHDNGWQSGPVDLDTPELKELVDHIKEKIPYFAELYGLNEKADPIVSDMWINRNSQGLQNSFNADPHLHANHFISFVFYPEADDKSANLVLLNPNQVVEFAIPANLQDYSTTYNSHRMTISPTTGLLVAFPSWVMHWIDACPYPQDRYSIALNVTLSHINNR